MTQKTTTKCDNCREETDNPKAEGWNKVNLHPWDRLAPEAGDPVPDTWLIRDLCPACAEKVRQWLQGTLVAVFRKPKGKKGA